MRRKTRRTDFQKRYVFWNFLSPKTEGRGGDTLKIPRFSSFSRLFLEIPGRRFSQKSCFSCKSNLLKIRDFYHNTSAFLLKVSPFYVPPKLRQTFDFRKYTRFPVSKLCVTHFNFFGDFFPRDAIKSLFHKVQACFCRNDPLFSTSPPIWPFPPNFRFSKNSENFQEIPGPKFTKFSKCRGG